MKKCAEQKKPQKKQTEEKHVVKGEGLYMEGQDCISGKVNGPESDLGRPWPNLVGPDSLGSGPESAGPHSVWAQEGRSATAALDSPSLSRHPRRWCHSGKVQQTPGSRCHDEKRREGGSEGGRGRRGFLSQLFSFSGPNFSRRSLTI